MTIAPEDRRTIQSRVLSFVLLAVGAALLALLAGGCAVSAFGRRPNPEAIGALQIHVSVKADALRVLGPPVGGGRAQFPTEDTPCDVWFYFYEEGSTQDNQRVYLLLFFRDGVYTGSMWFSSLPPL